MDFFFEEDTHLPEEFTERRANTRNGSAVPERLEVLRAVGEDALELKLGEHERALLVHVGPIVEILRSCEHVVLAFRIAPLKGALERAQEHEGRGTKRIARSQSLGSRPWNVRAEDRAGGTAEI